MGYPWNVQLFSCKYTISTLSTETKDTFLRDFHEISHGFGFLLNSFQVAKDGDNQTKC